MVTNPPGLMGWHVDCEKTSVRRFPGKRCVECRKEREGEQYVQVEITNPYVKLLESYKKLLREAVKDFNDGLNVGMGWVARAERLLGDD